MNSSKKYLIWDTDSLVFCITNMITFIESMQKENADRLLISFNSEDLQTIRTALAIYYSFKNGNYIITPKEEGDEHPR